MYLFGFIVGLALFSIWLVLSLLYWNKNDTAMEGNPFAQDSNGKMCSIVKLWLYTRLASVGLIPICEFFQVRPAHVGTVGYIGIILFIRLVFSIFDRAWWYVLVGASVAKSWRGLVDNADNHESNSAHQRSYGNTTAASTTIVARVHGLRKVEWRSITGLVIFGSIVDMTALISLSSLSLAPRVFEVDEQESSSSPLTILLPLSIHRLTFYVYALSCARYQLAKLKGQRSRLLNATIQAENQLDRISRYAGYIRMHRQSRTCLTLLLALTASWCIVSLILPQLFLNYWSYLILDESCFILLFFFIYFVIS